MNNIVKSIILKSSDCYIFSITLFGVGLAQAYYILHKGAPDCNYSVLR